MLRHRRPAYPAAPLLVQETHRPPAPILRHVDQVVGSCRPDVEVRFSHQFFRRPYVDVVHVADEDLATLLGVSEARPMQRLLSTLALVAFLRTHRVALVRTVNATEDQRTRPTLVRFARTLLDRATTTFVALDSSTSTPDHHRTIVIPHAHFRDRFVGFPRNRQVRGRLLSIGSGQVADVASALLDTMRETRTPGLTLRLVGEVPRDAVAAFREANRGNLGMISVRAEQLSDGARVQEIDAAELVIAPRAHTLSELQNVFLALSLDRAVLTPRTDAMAHLTSQVGPGWVFLSEGPITAEAIDNAVQSLRGVPRLRRPDLDGRDLASSHEAYAQVFREAARARRAGRPTG